MANELRRDNGNILGNENVTFVIDTLHDRRNGYLFQTNPLGALRDMTITDDQQNPAWNGIWYVKAARFEHGWTVEVAIPFKSLRYRSSGPQTWGINLRRLVKWKNEFSYLSLVPAALGTGGREPDGVGRHPRRHRDARGLEEHRAEALRGGVGHDQSRHAPCRTTTLSTPNAGLDVKYGLTRSLIVDGTYRTDFAQVEEDLQQVNLTRFSLFFPEKRDFFIEGQGIFDFGGVQAGNSPGDVPLLFYSRQIGLSNGQAVPVLAGGRLTGRAGAYSIGALNIQTDDAPEAARRRHELHRAALQAQPASPQQRRRARDPPRAGRRWRGGPDRRAELHRRRRRDDALPDEHQPDGLLRAHGNAGARGR